MKAGSTRDKIIFAAMELFAMKGYQSTSIADLLSRTQLNSGSLYHAFPGKQDVLVAVLETYLNGIGPMLLEPVWRGVDDPIEKIFALLDGYRLQLAESDCQAGCPIGSLSLEIHEPDPKVRELIAANFNAWVDAVHSCLTEAGDRLPSDLDRRALAEWVLTTMEGAIMQARAHRDLGVFDRNVEQLKRHIELLEIRARSDA